MTVLAQAVSEAEAELDLLVLCFSTSLVLGVSHKSPCQALCMSAGDGTGVLVLAKQALPRLNHPQLLDQTDSMESEKQGKGMDVAW